MDRNSTEQYSSNQIIVRDASTEDARAIMHIWNSNISSTLNTFNSHIKTELEIKDTILETNKKNYGFFVSERALAAGKHRCVFLPLGIVPQSPLMLP